MIVGELHQVKQVGQVCPEIFCCALALLPFADALIFQARLPELDLHLPDRLRNAGARSTINAGFKAWQVAQEQPVPVLQEECVGQRSRGIRYHEGG